MAYTTHTRTPNGTATRLGIFPTLEKAQPATPAAKKPVIGARFIPLPNEVTPSPSRGRQVTAVFPSLQVRG
jgi:hypothetical protein